MTPPYRSTGQRDRTVPGPANAHRSPLSRPVLAQLWLLAGTAIVSTCLLVWLILLPLYGRPQRASNLLAASFGIPDEVVWPVTFQYRDARLLGGDSSSEDGTPDGARTAHASFGRKVEDLYEAQRGRPVVIFLSAAGVDRPDEPEGPRAFLLTSSGPPGSAESQVSLGSALRLIENRARSSPTLLILDAGQIASDRNLGVFGNNFPSRLESLLSESGNLVVLSSCGPGQMSWTAEADGCSVFARYVAEGLAGQADPLGRVSVQRLYRYVRTGVARWVEQYREAVQTPVLLGNTGIDFALPKLADPRPVPLVPKEESEAVWEGLRRGWEERQRLAVAGSHPPPTRHAALPWRRYQESLLRAERLARSGEWSKARRALGQAQGHRADVGRLIRGLAIGAPWSLALLEKGGATSPDVRAEIERHERAWNAILGDAEDARPARAGRPPAGAHPEAPGAKDAGGAAEQKGGAEKKGPGEPGAPHPGPPHPGEEAAAGPESLAVTDQGGWPIFVEDQIPVWYSSFVRRGGAAKELRSQRLGLLPRAQEVRTLAEKAAACDPRVIGWVRGLVDDADRLRREAQDYLFASDPPSLQKSGILLLKAEVIYQEAVQQAKACAGALDLLQQLEDELPYYGEWAARSPGGMSQGFEELLENTARLADLADRLSGPVDVLRGGDEHSQARRKELIATSAVLKRAYDAFEAVFRTKLGAIADWREVDAVLCVPKIPAEERRRLCRLAGSRELTPVLGFGSVTPAEQPAYKPDPVFLKQALDLARLERGLLRVGGRDVKDLPDLPRKPPAFVLEDTSRIMDALGDVSVRLRKLRAAVVEARGEVAGADRATRTLPAADLIRLVDDPSQQVAESHLRALKAWHALRLCDDFAFDTARRLLADVEDDGGKDSPNIRDLVIRRSTAELRIQNDGNDGFRHLRITPSEDLPPGHAAAFLEHDPGVPVSAEPRKHRGDPTTNLIPVPTPTDWPGLGFDLDPLAMRANVRLTPVVFYRGLFFSDKGGGQTFRSRDPVTVEIHQSKTVTRYRNKLYRWPDQFVEHPNEGYLHTKSTLEYKLRVTNWTRRDLRLTVSHGLGIAPPRKKTIDLKGEASDETTVGVVRSEDIPADQPATLSVGVTDDRDGQPLLREPLTIVLRKGDPLTYIVYQRAFQQGVFYLRNYHTQNDPVPVPATVGIKVEPFTVLEQVDRNSNLIPRGAFTTFEYRILDLRAPAFKWTLSVEGALDVIAKEEILNQIAPELARPPVDKKMDAPPIAKP